MVILAYFFFLFDGTYTDFWSLVSLWENISLHGRVLVQESCIMWQFGVSGHRLELVYEVYLKTIMAGTCGISHKKNLQHYGHCQRWCVLHSSLLRCEESVYF